MGQLPLHRALQNNIRLGSIKLLVKGDLHVIESHDNRGALPLHVACLYHESASVVQHLFGLDKTTLDAVDRVGNTTLHYACRDAKYETIAPASGEV
jgi:ankyrin repeat protein